MIVIGIDPGVSGGIASWSDDPLHPEEMMVSKMPDTEHDLAGRLRPLLGVPCFAYIEKVSASPQMGVTSSFTFGRGYGFLRGCLISYGIPFEEVLPRKWQASFGMKKDKNESNTQWKNRLKGKAQQLFPHIKVTLATADALLICEYGRRLRCQPEKR